MRSKLSRYWPLTHATYLVLLAGCGAESARPGQVSDLPAAVTSSVLASDAGTNSGPLPSSSGAGMTTIMSKISGITEYRLIQKTKNKIEVFLVKSDQYTKKTDSEILHYFKKYVGDSINIQIKYVQSI